MVNTLVGRTAQLIRNLHDMGVGLSTKLVAYEGSTLYRYKISRTDYGDQTKTLINVVPNCPVYVDFPGDVDGSANNSLFVEDLLPITAQFPWKVNNQDLLVDIYDELEFKIEDELGNIKLMRYEIVNKTSTFVQTYLNREFILAPKRVDVINLARHGVTGYTGAQVTGAPTGVLAESFVTGVFLDPNIEIGSASNPVESKYDGFY